MNIDIYIYRLCTTHFDTMAMAALREKQKETPLKLQHQRSNNARVTARMIDVSNMVELDTMMESLHLFAKYGFVHGNSINSLYQFIEEIPK